MYEKVQHNKCFMCSKLILSQFLSTLEVKKRVLGCAPYLETPFYTFFNKNWLYITNPVPLSIKALRVPELVPTVKMLDKNF